VLVLTINSKLPVGWPKSHLKLPGNLVGLSILLSMESLMLQWLEVAGEIAEIKVDVEVVDEIACEITRSQVKSR